MTPTIRPATAADADAMRRLAVLAFTRYVDRLGCEPYPMTADYAAVAARGHGWVLEDGGPPVALTVLEPAGDHLVVDTIAVDPGAQGRGLGSRLLRFAEDRARALGLPRLRLCTNARMTENLAFYPRRGFLETHRATEDGFERVFFAKDVTPAA